MDLNEQFKQTFIQMFQSSLLLHHSFVYLAAKTFTKYDLLNKVAF